MYFLILEYTVIYSSLSNTGLHIKTKVLSRSYRKTKQDEK